MKEPKEPPKIVQCCYCKNRDFLNRTTRELYFNLQEGEKITTAHGCYACSDFAKENKVKK